MSFVAEIYAGRILGRYELLLPIAQGGTASVWAAKMSGSRGFEKIVAVKTVLADFDDSLEAESMFLDEARLVARIRHPNVAEVLDLGEEDDALYIVMEWVDGEPLQVLSREAAKQGGMPLHIAARIVKQVSSGLHAAHELRDEQGTFLNLVHRDVSPQNIMVGVDGVVKVIDFGIAKAMSNVQRTTVGQLKGKAPYMAPEQALGNPVDRRADVFALGIVLYQLVTGKHPFRADNEFATLVRVRDKSPAAPPSSIVPNLPPALEKVILKALAKERNDRYGNMLELQRSLLEAVPRAEGGPEELAALMKKLVGHRSEKRAHAVRDAVRLANERSAGGRPQPRAMPHAIFDEETDDQPPVRAIAKEPTAAAPAIASVAAPPARPLPLPSIAGAPEPELSVMQPVPSIRRGIPSRALIAAGIAAIVVIVAIVAWSTSSPEPAPGDPPPAKKAW